MKRFCIAVCLMLASGCVSARPSGWPPSSAQTQTPIWPGVVPDVQAPPGPESTTVKSDHPIAGKSVVVVTNVSQPTMTVYPARGNNTGAAVVVFPGGGYQVLAIDLEGTEVCDWLTSRGITAVLLKYRVPIKRVGPYGESLQALEDAQRTLGLVRFHAAEWHIDPHKIGVIGFSAGGHMVAATSTLYHKRLYAAVDAADNESCRPDFAIACYPGHLWSDDDEEQHPDELKLNPNVPVTADTPPTFIVQATDDPVDSVQHSLAYYFALKKAKVPVEMHLFARGGHAIGFRRTQEPITQWPDLVEKWLETIGITPR